MSCPNLVTTYNPACQEMYVYYKMSSDEVTNTGQTIVDASGNSNDGTNGVATANTSKDCSRWVDAYRVVRLTISTSMEAV